MANTCWKLLAGTEGGSNAKIYVNTKRTQVKKVYEKNHAASCQHEFEVYEQLADHNVPHVVEFKNRYDPSTNDIIMSYYPYTLEELITSKRITNENKKRIEQQLIEFLSSAHSAGVSHMDFKAKNIMVANNFNIYVTDFDMSEYGAKMDIYDDYKRLTILLLQLKKNMSYQEAYTAFLNDL